MKFYFDTEKCPPFSSTVSVETDASTAKQCCSVGYGIKRRIEEATGSYTLMHAAVEALTYYTHNHVVFVKLHIFFPFLFIVL